MLMLLTWRPHLEKLGPRGSLILLKFHAQSVCMCLCGFFLACAVQFSSESQNELIYKQKSMTLRTFAKAQYLKEC